MRLFEFETVSPIRAAAKEYASQGYKLLARGASALVLSNGQDIIKIGPTKDCWLNFAKNAQSASNKHLPKIDSLEIIGSHYLAKVEKLVDTPDNFFKSTIYRKIASWLVVNAKWRTPRDVYLGEFTPGQIKKFSNMLIDEDPEIVAALEIVVAAKGPCNFDLHPDNIMKRRNGTIVLNDPLTMQG